MTDEESLLGFAPVDFFFAEQVDCQQVAEESLSKKHLLPPLAEVFGQESFAKVYMGWNLSGLIWQVEVEQPKPVVVSFPDIRHADSIELFIDTRALQQARTTHRFCHHFYFLPESFEGKSCGEITRFRTEDSHPLASIELLELKVTKKARSYTAHIHISKDALVGYDPQNGSRLGFTYRINRSDDESQHFAFHDEQSRLESLPYLWATLRLTN